MIPSSKRVLGKEKAISLLVKQSPPLGDLRA